MCGLVVDIIHTSSHFFSSEDPLLVYVIHPVYWILLSDLSPPLRFLTHFMWGAHFRAVTLNILNRYLSILPAISLGISPAAPPCIKWQLIENENWILCSISLCITSQSEHDQMKLQQCWREVFFFKILLLFQPEVNHSSCEKKVPHNKLEVSEDVISRMKIWTEIRG